MARQNNFPRTSGRYQTIRKVACPLFVYPMGIGTTLGLLALLFGKADAEPAKLAQQIESKLEAIASYVDPYGRKLPKIKINGDEIIYDLIHNGGFEDPNDYSWYVIDQQNGTVNLFDSTDVFDGKFSCFMSPTAKFSFSWVGAGQSFDMDKKPSDFDIDNNLIWNSKLKSSNLFEVLISFRTIGDLNGPRISYLWGAAFPETNLSKVVYLGSTMPKDWTEYKRNMGGDWINKGLPEDAGGIKTVRIYACTNNNKAEAVSFDDIELWAKLWNDVGVSLLNPSDVIGSITPVLRISSNGMNTQEGIRVEVEIRDKNGNGVYEHIGSIDSIPSQQYTDLQCKPWIPEADGEYTFKASVDRKDDEIPENDILEVKLTATGIAERPGQNIPSKLEFDILGNIVNKRAIIEYKLPESGIVNIDVYGVDGRRVKSSKIIGYQGLNRAGIDFDGIAAGPYFITLKDKTGSTKTGKIILTGSKN